jgi:pimeloyl-ACP methyl ester carboxylesterase
MRAIGDARLDVPVLCMVGRATRASTRRIAELLQARLPDVVAITVEAMGHLGPITHPDLVALRFAHFVRSEAATRNLPDSVAA